MLPSSSAAITQLLEAAQGSDAGALNALFPLVYDALRGLAQCQRLGWHGDYTVNTTALVHEVYFKLVDQKQADWKNRAHFFAVAAKAMRHILIDYAERRRTTKRGGDVQKVSLEAQAASALDHPHICTVYEINETQAGQIFIAMACYDGETLKKKIARGPLPVDTALDYVTQAAEGLAQAHTQGIVHRDVKPANVMVTRDGRVKILDFGLAKLAGSLPLTQTGTTLGTLAYMSPEQARGDFFCVITQN